MQRVSPDSRHVVTLSMLLREQRLMAAQNALPEPVPDPVVTLEAERQRVLALAKDEGFAAGMANAQQEIEKRALAAEDRIAKTHAAESERLTVAMEHVGRLLQGIPQAMEVSQAQIEPVIVETVFAAITRVLGTIAGEGNLVERVSRQALDEYRQRPVVLKVSPGDVEFLRDLAAEPGIRVETDTLLASGACRLETHKGLYDAGLEVRLEALKQGLLHALQTPVRAVP